LCFLSLGGQSPDQRTGVLQGEIEQKYRAANDRSDAHLPNAQTHAQPERERKAFYLGAAPSGFP